MAYEKAAVRYVRIAQDFCIYTHRLRSSVASPKTQALGS